METSCGVVLVNFGSVLLLQYPQGHWGFPKGHYEAEDGAYQQTALRELEEETGYSATSFQSLGQVTPLAGFCDEIQHLFVAKDLSLTTRFECDEDEVIEVIELSLEELQDKIRHDQITDTKTIACLSKALLCGYL